MITYSLINNYLHWALKLEHKVLGMHRGITAEIADFKLDGPQRFDLAQTKVLQHIEKTYKLLLAHDIVCKPFSVTALQKLLRVTEPEKLKSMTENFASTVELLEEIIPTEDEEPYEKEITALKNSLSKLRLRVDNEFWTHLQKGDVIEVYGEDMVQRHRSFNFYQKTSYSLLDLTVHEWYLLWERSEKVLKELLPLTAEIMSGKGTPGPCHLPPHLVREVFNSGVTEPFEPQVLAVNFKYIFPLYRSVSSKVEGFVITSTCNLVSTGQDVHSLSMI
jgi:hypothetical protein